MFHKEKKKNEQFGKKEKANFETHKISELPQAQGQPTLVYSHRNALPLLLLRAGPLRHHRRWTEHNRVRLVPPRRGGAANSAPPPLPPPCAGQPSLPCYLRPPSAPVVSQNDDEDPFEPTGFITAFSTWSLEPYPVFAHSSLSFAGHLAELERVLETTSQGNNSSASGPSVVVDNLRAYLQIIDVASILGLDYDISDHAFQLFRDCSSATCLRNRSVEALATAALVQAIREAQEPRTLQTCLRNSEPFDWNFLPDEHNQAIKAHLHMCNSPPIKQMNVVMKSSFIIKQNTDLLLLFLLATNIQYCHPLEFWPLLEVNGIDDYNLNHRPKVAVTNVKQIQTERQLGYFDSPFNHLLSSTKSDLVGPNQLGEFAYLTRMVLMMVLAASKEYFEASKLFKCFLSLDCFSAKVMVAFLEEWLTEVTLRKVYKELLENWDDLLPSNYNPVVPPEKAFPTATISSGRSSSSRGDLIEGASHQSIGKDNAESKDSFHRAFNAALLGTPFWKPQVPVSTSANQRPPETNQISTQNMEIDILSKTSEEKGRDTDTKTASSSLRPIQFPSPPALAAGVVPWPFRPQ
ncbi:UNVERIFIED_CONTAM: Plant-specific TFIIB-related protein 1 [Sesamum angustifolium]|uniref:Plant-specific TFIIB-related protein 1 n=1 Tax=Sesamum angustifolium TaxID=2727405 RepID=A0AAW2NHM0_9LAMI